MKFWKTKDYSSIIDINYEQLVKNKESEIKKIINFCELNWEEECLSPHQNKRIVQTASQQQVRQKVYNGSSEEWRKFEAFIEGAFDELI